MQDATLNPNVDFDRPASSAVGTSTIVIQPTLDGRVLTEVVVEVDRQTGIAQGFEQ